MKIKVCIPQYCGVSAPTKKSVEAIMASHNVDFVAAEVAYIARGRNVMIAGCENSLIHPPLPDYTHFLSVDSDMGFGPSHLEQLLAHDLPIVSGLYQRRAPETNACAGEYKLVDGNMGKHLGMDATGLQKVRWVGAGFLLVKREVFEKIEYPWFRHEWIQFKDGDDKHQMQSSEDIGFCMAAERAGYDIMVDADCKVLHFLDRSKLYGRPEQDRTPVDAMEIRVQQDLRNIGDTFSMLCRAAREGGRIGYNG